MQPLTVIVVVFGVFLYSDAKHLDRCELVRELRHHGFPQHQLADWVCLVEHESSSNTHVIGSLNADGSHDYGLFQINDRYWCSHGWPGKECHVTCNELLSDDISKAANCAKKIYGIHGFRAWYAWIAHCQGTLPDISYC